MKKIFLGTSFVLVFSMGKVQADVKSLYKDIYRVGETIALLTQPRVEYLNKKYPFARSVQEDHSNSRFFPGNGYCKLLFGNDSYTNEASIFKNKREHFVPGLNLTAEGTINPTHPVFENVQPIEAIFCFVPKGKMPAGVENILTSSTEKLDDVTVKINSASLRLPFSLTKDRWEIEDDRPSDYRLMLYVARREGDIFTKVNSSMCQQLGYRSYLEAGYSEDYNVGSDHSFLNGFISGSRYLGRIADYIICK